MLNLYSSPSFLPRSPCLIFVILFLQTTLCLAVRCWSLPSSIQPPSSSDCRHILAYLPSLHQVINTNNDVNGAQRRVASSSPFFPNGDVWHGTCGMRFTTFNASEGLLLFNSPALAVTELGALGMWSRMRVDASRLVAECVDHLRVGSMTSVVDGMAYPDLAYEVRVHKRGLSDADWRHHRHPNLDVDPHHVFLDRFARPYYDV